MNERDLVFSWVEEFVTEYPKAHSVRTHWRKPIVGIADAKDPLYAELKTIISPSHAMPEDLIAGAKSVIAVFVPFEESVGKSNTGGGEVSKEWDYAYIETNEMLNSLAAYMYEKITAAGHQATNLPATYNYDEERLISDWSHRSSAYIAGIGKFGINNMMITEQGSCGRYTSIVTDWELEPTKRSEEEFCLYKINRSCKKCIEQCPVGAFSIAEDGEVVYNRFACNAHLYEGVHEEKMEGSETCGKCMVGLPCSYKKPRRD